MTASLTVPVRPMFPSRTRSWRPVDDSPAVAVPSPYVQGTLALSYALPSGLPADPGLRLVPDQSGDYRPDPVRWAHRFVQILVEVVSGDRPPAQLVRWTTRPVYLAVAEHAQSQSRHRVRKHARLGRQQVAAVRVSQPDGKAIEVCARIRSGERFRALAARLDVTDDGWQCTALELG